MQTGLVLEGGAMRGIYTAGVLDVFLENGVLFDGVIGVSAGAIHGCSYVSGQAGRSIRYYKKYCRDRRFMSVYSLLTTGDLVGRDFCYRQLPRVLDPFDDEAFRRSPTAFYAVCTNVDTGCAEYLRCTDLAQPAQMDLLRASASMPLVSRTVCAGRRRLLDGGVADSIPSARFAAMGYPRQVVVCTQPRGFVRQPEALGAIRLRYHRYPAFVQAMARRHLRYNQTLQQLAASEAAGDLLVIAPSQDLHIHRTEHDPERLQAQYDLGRADAQAKLAEVQAFLRQE